MQMTIPKTNFLVRTDAYEGPFELVLNLIETRKLLVNDLTLTNITDDFITHIRAKETFPIDEAANFIQIASTLLLIKSKSLIPDLILSEEEDADVEELKNRLTAYERVRIATRELLRTFGIVILAPAGIRAPEIVFAPSNDLSAKILTGALTRLLVAHKKAEEFQTVVVKPLVSIEEMMDRLVFRVESVMTLFFKEFTGDLKEKVEIIVSFLALLELVKQDLVAVEQFDRYGDIRISHTAPQNTPRYQ